jgi:hypothetical protein
LDPADAAALAAWLERMRPKGIDAAIDISSRRWNVPGAQALIGLFQEGEARARWLLVRHEDGWLLLRPCDAFALTAPRALEDVLAVIAAEPAQPCA